MIFSFHPEAEEEFEAAVAWSKTTGSASLPSCF